MKNRIGIVGICIAVVALGIAIFQDDIRPEQPSATTSLGDRVFEVVKSIGSDDTDKRLSRDWVTLTYIGLGFVALVAGIVSFIRKEDHRVSGMAGAIGVVAIGWEYVLIGVVIAVVLFLLAYFSP